MTFNDLPLMKMLKVDAGYSFTYVSRNERRRDCLEAKNEIYLDIYSATYFNPGLKIVYDTQYDYLYFDFYTISIYTLKDFPAFRKFRLKNTSNMYFLTKKFNKSQYGINKNMLTAAHNELYLEYQMNSRTSFGPTFELTRAIDDKVKECWKDSNRTALCNYLIGFRFDTTF